MKWIVVALVVAGCSEPAAPPAPVAPPAPPATPAPPPAPPRKPKRAVSKGQVSVAVFKGDRLDRCFMGQALLGHPLGEAASNTPALDQAARLVVEDALIYFRSGDSLLGRALYARTDPYSKLVESLVTGKYHARLRAAAEAPAKTKQERASKK